MTTPNTQTPNVQTVDTAYGQAQVQMVDTCYGPARLTLTPEGDAALLWKGPTINGKTYYNAQASITRTKRAHTEATIPSGPDTVQLVTPPNGLIAELLRIRKLYR